MTTWIRNIWEEVARPLIQRPSRVQVAALCTRKAGPGDDVLLSPAFSSLDQFSGYTDRGEQYVSLVEALPSSQ